MILPRGRIQPLPGIGYSGLSALIQYYLGLVNESVTSLIHRTLRVMSAPATCQHGFHLRRTFRVSVALPDLSHPFCGGFDKRRNHALTTQ